MRAKDFRLLLLTACADGGLERMNAVCAAMTAQQLHQVGDDLRVELAGPPASTDGR